MQNRLRLAHIVLCLVASLCLNAAVSAQSRLKAPDIELPNLPSALRFAAIGDNGTGEKPEYEVGEQMARAHTAFPFDFVVMLGDNIYGKKGPKEFERKFEEPYKDLLTNGVKFYASLGNHDDPNERFYQPYNMNGQRYYKLSKGAVDLFALDSTYFDRSQLDWLVKQLSSSNAKWKICFFHHPLYSASHFHGPDVDLRSQLEPILEKYNVNVVLNGHEHVYERIKPQHGIYYFVLGNSGQLRFHDLRSSDETAKGFDTDRAFMLMAATDDDLYFQTISRAGDTVDSGHIKRERK